MGYAYYLLGDVQLARRFLLRGVEIDPDSSRLQYHLGLVWMESGSHAQARAAFERANRMEPEGPIGTLSELAIESMSR
jgi:tetratricopeptide (TPR) repeat protein